MRKKIEPLKPAAAPSTTNGVLKDLQDAITELELAVDTLTDETRTVRAGGEFEEQTPDYPEAESRVGAHVASQISRVYRLSAAVKFLTKTLDKAVTGV